MPKRAVVPPVEPPPTRPLKVYAFDPTQGRSLGNIMTIHVPYEPLERGPAGKSVVVIDYDATNDVYYAPVDLDEPGVLLRGGLDPTESDPRFHQQMVYAVVSKTVEHFEHALGRSIRWSFARWSGTKSEDRSRLRIFPHAMQEANAYYDPQMRALLFGYFQASETDSGASLPGQVVFTCLSHDIVCHEATHALVDSQREFFLEPTSADAPAFHEAFADIVALFQHFGLKDALVEVIRRTGGLIHRSTVGADITPGFEGPTIAAELTRTNPLVELARQFGEAMGTRKALRSALGTKPNSDDIKRLWEPHDRGSILVAAVFDAYFTIYTKRTRELLRLARAGGQMDGANALSAELADLLADTAAKTASQVLTMCIRALDYCPPIDIRYGDFLRALVTSDRELVPDDPNNYRAAFIDAFRLRGIVPDGVASYSEEALVWCPPEVLHGEAPVCEGLSFDLFRRRDDASYKKQQSQNARVLQSFAKANAEAFGLSPELPIQARNFHFVHRVGPDGQLLFDVVAEFMQKREVPVDPEDPTGPAFTFRGGSTVIIASDGKARYSIQKSIGDPNDDENNERLQAQRAYMASLEAGVPFALAAGRRSNAKARALNFSRVHRGY